MTSPRAYDHWLLHIVARVVDDLMARVAVEMPEQVLTKRMLLAHGLANEALIRKAQSIVRRLVVSHEKHDEGQGSI